MVNCPVWFKKATPHFEILNLVHIFHFSRKLRTYLHIYYLLRRNVV